ncbi:hypothetical protein DL98DRAFT_567755 [Cadophora sp. DSE1049]|nr:hypothetical protein DL98DRAFT_567755 [Cadophora sp. DSE1049]
MRLLFGTIWIIPAILGAPSVRMESKEALLFVKFDKTTSQTEITVADSATNVLGQSCSTILRSGPFVDFQISTRLDENGAGNVTLGANTYLVHELTEYSGGITCTRMYNDLDSFVRCSIEVPETLRLAPLSEKSLVECFARGTVDMERTSHIFASQLEGSDDYSVNSVAVDLLPEVGNTNTTVWNTTEKRADCNAWTKGVVRIGNGDPHQNYLNTQISENIFCGAADQCSVGRENSRSYGVSYSWGGNFGGWGSGGFAVDQSTTTGNTYSCTAHTGQTLCMWRNTAHTAYSVQTRERNPCYADQWGERYVLVSPNSNNVGSYYYCVVGTCRNQGNNWMDRNGRAGGP